MKAKSNSMASALARKNPVTAFTKEHQAFIEKGNVSKSPKPENDPKPKAKPAKKEVKKEVIKEEPLTMLSVRVPGKVLEGLFDAQVDRKRRKMKRSSRQQIVTDILERWLKENKYL